VPAVLLRGTKHPGKSVFFRRLVLCLSLATSCSSPQLGIIVAWAATATFPATFSSGLRASTPCLCSGHLGLLWFGFALSPWLPVAARRRLFGATCCCRFTFFPEFFGSPYGRQGPSRTVADLGPRY
jgi:hypothetical protein